MPKFSLQSDFIELNKLLKITGLCDTGGQSNQVITLGQVAVNGQPELRKRYKVRRGDQIEFAGETISVA